MDELTRYLLSDRSPHPKLSGEMLEMMGKEAAVRLFNDGVAMNETIAKLAGSYPDINAEQVKRICEFANTAAYLAEHDKAKTAGAESSYPQFDLADPAHVIHDLSDGARPTRVSPTDVAYGRLPERKSKTSAAAEDALAEMFHVKTAEAEPEYTRQSVVNDIFSTKDDLKTLHDHVTSTAENLDLMWKEASEELYELTKRHILDGGSMADLVKVARDSGLDSDEAVSALKPVTVRLMKEKVASPEQLKQQVLDYIKVAHRQMDETHPIVKTFKAVADLDSEIHKVATGLQDIERELGRVNAFIKEQFRAGTAG